MRHTDGWRTTASSRVNGSVLNSFHALGSGDVLHRETNRSRPVGGRVCPWLCVVCGHKWQYDNPKSPISHIWFSRNKTRPNNARLERLQCTCNEETSRSVWNYELTRPEITGPLYKQQQSNTLYQKSLGKSKSNMIFVTKRCVYFTLFCQCHKNGLWLFWKLHVIIINLNLYKIALAK